MANAIIRRNLRFITIILTVVILSITRVNVNLVTMAQGAITVSFDNPMGSAGELTSPYVATVVLNTGDETTTEAITVNVNATNGTATNGVDFTFTNPTQVTFPIGSEDGATQTVDVVTVDDNNSTEMDESFSLNLTVTSNNAMLGANDTQNVTLYDNSIIRDSLYWMGNNKFSGVSRTALDGTDNEQIVAAGIPSRVVYDASTNKIYWTESLSLVRRSDPDGSNPETILSGLSVPNNLAIDPMEGKLYVGTIDTPRQIIRTNLDGSGLEVIVNSSGSVDAVAVDVVNRKLYWVDRFNNQLRQADLDGSNPTTIYTGGFTVNIAVDAANNALYWVEASNNLVRRANLDGTNPQTIISSPTVSFPTAIDVDERSGKIYYVGQGLYQADLDGNNTENLFTVGSLTDVAVAYNVPVQQDISVEFAAGTDSGIESVLNPPILSVSTWNSGVTLRDVTVELSVTGATVGDDYTFTNSVTIPAGTAAGTVALPDAGFAVVDDNIIEPDEIIQLTLSNPGGVATLGTQTTLDYTIIDDDNCADVIVGTEAELTTAITDFNFDCMDSESMTITVNGEITMTTDPTVIDNTTTAELTITGGTLDGANTFRTMNITHGNVVIDNMTLRNGSSTDNGGAINKAFGSFGSLTINNSTLSGNSADEGGAVYDPTNNTLTITASTFIGNIAGNSNTGGAVNKVGSGANISNSTFNNNSAGFAGSALSISGSGTVANNTFVNNIVTDPSDVNFGGALFVFNNSPITVDVTNNTFADNQAPNGGALFVTTFADDSNNVNINNNIMVGSTTDGTTVTSGCFVNAFADPPTITLSAGQTNLIQMDGTDANACGFDENNSIMIDERADVLLGDLQDNGGLVETMALLIDSPAINAGDTTAANNAGLTTDARGGGFARINYITVDLGSVEFITEVGTDVNNDSIVSPSDAMYVNNRLDSDDWTADVNGDGRINIADFDLVFNALVQAGQP